MTPPVSLGPCPDCGEELVVPGFSARAVAPRCVACDGAAPDVRGLDEARRFVREEYAGCDERDLALVLSASVGQALAAFLGGERAAARAFLANVIALGEMMLDG